MPLLGVGVVVLALALSLGLGPGSRDGAVPTARVERRNLEIVLVEPGTLAAARSITIASEIRGDRAKIVTIGTDGDWVRAGDELVRFDPTPFEEERRRRESELKDVEARLASAEQERKLQVARAEEALAAARQRSSLADGHLAAFEKGNGRLAVREAEVHAADANADLERARRDLADVESMLARGFVSRGELERARARVQEIERKRGLAGDRLAAARDVVFPRDLGQAKDDARAMRDAVARAEGVLYHTHEFYRAAVDGAARKVEAARTALTAAEAALEKTVIRAPINGFLILQEIAFESGRRKPQIGDAVWLGQPIATLPDLSQMIVTTRIREVDLPRIHAGTPARIAVEAVPDVPLAARVDAIGSLAVAVENAAWKFFDVRLLLGEGDRRLRPGMSTRVEFLLDSAPDALVIPIDAVFGEDRRPICFVRRDGDVWEERVELGKRDDTHVEVRDGLRLGDEVLLVRPRSAVRRSARAAPSA